MKIELNSPLVLFNLTVLGFGLELSVERSQGKSSVYITAQALVWSGYWKVYG